MKNTDLIIYLVEVRLTPDEATTIVRYDFKNALRLLNKIKNDITKRKGRG